ncbi:hypothetical protein D3C78_1332320 [compost metagenome]
MLEITGFQHRALAVHIAGLGAPQHQLADGVGEARRGRGMAFAHQLFGRGVVGGEQHFERAAVDDLRVELARGAERQLGRVAGVPGEVLGNLLHGRREVRGHGHGDFRRLGRQPGGEAGDGGEAQSGAGDVQASHGFAIPLVNNEV